jgi:hypothetical protein
MRRTQKGADEYRGGSTRLEELLLLTSEADLVVTSQDPDEYSSLVRK